MLWKNALNRLLLKRNKASTASQNQTVGQTKAASPIKAVSEGIAVQPPEVDQSFQHKQLVIGLDFGTAFTKVVVGEDRMKMAIPLRGNGDNSSDYLLPTVYWSNAAGECSIDVHSGVRHSDLKMPIIEGKFSNKDIQKIGCYLALVLRRVRAFIFSDKIDVYGRNYIDWLINIGLPTQSYHDHKLIHVYKRVLQAAWRVSAEPREVTQARIYEILDEPEILGETDKVAGTNLHPEAISVFPEFVAQVTGYVRSPLRQPNLHLLIDVGAGTLDVTTFNVHEEDQEDRFPIFAKAIKPLGTNFLIRHRIKGKAFKENIDPFSPVPEKHRFAELLQIKLEEMEEIDEPFRQQVNKVLGELIRYTKNRRHPISERWESGVPVFLCGGGANCDVFQEIFHSESGKLAGVPIKLIKLPKPDQLISQEISKSDYDRISVAYGLSFDPLDIGEITREDEVSDLKPEDCLVSHSGTPPRGVICPSCQGTGGLYSFCDVCGGSGFI